VETSSVKPVKSGWSIPPPLNLKPQWSYSNVGGTVPLLMSPTLGQFPVLPKTGACSPDCSCPWGQRCYDSTRSKY
jgi:hypothetical protein